MKKIELDKKIAMWQSLGNPDEKKKFWDEMKEAKYKFSFVNPSLSYSLIKKWSNSIVTEEELKRNSVLTQYKVLTNFIKDYKHKLCLSSGVASNSTGLNFHFYAE